MNRRRKITRSILLSLKKKQKQANWKESRHVPKQMVVFRPNLFQCHQSSSPAIQPNRPIWLVPRDRSSFNGDNLLKLELWILTSPFICWKMFSLYCLNLGFVIHHHSLSLNMNTFQVPLVPRSIWTHWCSPVLGLTSFYAFPFQLALQWHQQKTSINSFFSSQGLWWCLWYLLPIHSFKMMEW